MATTGCRHRTPGEVTSAYSLQTTANGKEVAVLGLLKDGRAETFVRGRFGVSATGGHVDDFSALRDGFGGLFHRFIKGGDGIGAVAGDETLAKFITSVCR